MANFIEIQDGERIYKGNFAFIEAVTGNNNLFEKFYEAEKCLKTNYIDFAHKIRVAFEAFSLEEEYKKRKNIPGFVNTSENAIKEKIISDIIKPASTVNYKTIVSDICIPTTKKFIPVLSKYNFLRQTENISEARRSLKYCIRFIYAFGSSSSHNNIKYRDEYIPNKDNCLRLSELIHDFLCCYYNVSKNYENEIIPIGDYVVIPKKICENMGMTLATGKYLLVKENKERINYYIFSSNNENGTFSQKRDNETIGKLWDENIEDPANIVRKAGEISGSCNDYSYEIYTLPGRPYKLSFDLLKYLSLDDKIDIVYGICRGINSMHRYKPAFYHRNICPDAFYIFNIKGKYKALLARFDCAKDTSVDSKYTVLNNVEQQIKNSSTNKFFAPEVLNSNRGLNVDWEKADIYSLAKTCLFILTGKVIDIRTEQTVETFQENIIDNNLMKILLEMMSENPSDRPDIINILKK